jgi:NAD(P)H dehydrogenase (quinone)
LKGVISIDGFAAAGFTNSQRVRCGYITVDELAYATAKLACDDRHNGQILNLVGETLTQAKLVDLVNQVFGLKVQYETISDEENIAVLMQDPKIAKRGKNVAKMLTGCFQAVREGAFDVESDFERAAGRAVKPTLQMLREQQQLMSG